MNAAPRWRPPASSVPWMCSVWVSTVRATNVASAARAIVSGMIGRSIEPVGVDFVRLPNSLVGEVWPFVRP